MNEDITADVHEFGKAFMVSNSLDSKSAEAPINDLINMSIKETEHLFDYLKVVHYVEPFHRKDGPSIDALNRFSTVAWYGRVAAPGYDAFKEHFKCREPHRQHTITLKYIWKLIKIWIKQLKERDEDY